MIFFILVYFKRFEKITQTCKNVTDWMIRNRGFIFLNTKHCVFIHIHHFTPSCCVMRHFLFLLRRFQLLQHFYIDFCYIWYVYLRWGFLFNKKKRGGGDGSKFNEGAKHSSYLQQRIRLCSVNMDSHYRLMKKGCTTHW